MREAVFVIGVGAVGFVSSLVLLATGSVFLGVLMVTGASALVAMGVGNLN